MRLSGWGLGRHDFTAPMARRARPFGAQTAGPRRGAVKSSTPKAGVLKSHAEVVESGEMIGFLIRIVAFLAVGVAVAFLHARAVTEGERMHRETGERARPIALFVVRLVVLCAVFGVIGKMGLIPLGSAILGYFGGRVVVRRGLAAQAQRPQFPG